MTEVDSLLMRAVPRQNTDLPLNQTDERVTIPV